VLRAIKILPGVTSNNELSSAYNVRGGNYDENLIYLNGYQIYRPYLLRIGVEENQSLVNPDLTNSVNFYSGGFPARFGDRMSSVLEVKYGGDQSGEFRGVVRGDLFNFGIALHDATDNVSWSFGARYANPENFLNKLQTSGDYRPSYSDFQILLNYQPNDRRRLELLLLYANNKFDFTPQLWKGNFKFGQYDVRGVDIDYSGSQQYTFQTGLLGLKWEQQFSSQTQLFLTVAGFLSREDEDRNLTGDIYYVSNALEPWQERQYLNTRFESVDNQLELSNYDIGAGIIIQLDKHRLQTGISLKSNQVKNNLDEKFEESSENNLLEPVHLLYQNWVLNFNQVEWYGEDQFNPGNKIQINAGMRFLFYEYTNEKLFSPRFSLHYFPNEKHILYARWGFYYQPPYFYELRNLLEVESAQVSAQQSIHYILGWEHQLKTSLDLQIELYYKKLNRLIPYYLEDLQLIYAGTNQNEGYSQGIDILIKGEIIEGLNSWIGYSYLNTKERPIAGGDYRRRLLDQTHTLRFFVQDKIPKFPFLQFHTRIIYGSGYRYYPRIVVEDSQSDEKYIKIDFSRTLPYPYYGRVDMGLSTLLNTGKRPEVMIKLELLNAFNNFNVLGYTWIQVFDDIQGAVPVPRILTKRFLNLGVEVSF
jgi:hypothetical protein